MQNTPNRNYPYPDYADPANAPTQIQNFATAVDADHLANLDTPYTAAVDYPSCRVSRPIGTTSVPANTNTTLTFTVEDYDNDNMANLGVSNTNVIVNTPGVYLIGCSTNAQPTGVAGGAAALILMSSGGVVQNPIGTSRELHATLDTSLSGTTIHRVAVVPETLTIFARHNHGGAVLFGISQLSVTRIS